MTHILIPCYEGARTIGDVVLRAKAHGPVLVVDDGSTDGSGNLAEQAGATVLRHPVNRGKGAALATGFAFACRAYADAVVTLDADGQHDPDEIPKLLEAHRAEPRALIIGVRSFAAEDMPRRSRIGNRISTWWISKFAGRRHSDTQSGFRLYPAPLIALPLRSQRFETETELVLRAAKERLPLVEVPVKTIYAVEQSTHFRDFRDTLRVIRLVLGSLAW
jgi:glycosyltransferase involved in cell wall biosynthesis